MFLFSALLHLLLCFLLFNVAQFLIAKFLKKSPLKSIPGPPSPSFLTGHINQLFDRKNGPQFHQALIEKYDRVVKVKGFCGDEQLYISDPLALQSIIIKDQDNYEETSVFIENNKIIFGEGLVATIGEHHKRQRKLVNPVFSPQRLKGLVPIFYEVAHRLKESISRVIDQKGGSNGEVHRGSICSIDMAEWMSRAALESIGQAGLGYSFDPLNSPSTNLYTKTVRTLIPTMFQIAPLRLLTPFVTRLGPPSFRRFLLNLVPIKAVQSLKYMSDQMDASCRELLRVKREALDGNSGIAGGGDTVSVGLIGEGKDIVSVLMRANELASAGEKLNEAELLGQMNVLIFGAQDTTASALSRTLYLLSRPENRSLQMRLRNEILQAYEMNDGQDLSYEELSALPLLDAVLKETLRLYPPVPFIRRMTRKTSRLPLSRPITLEGDQSSSDYITVPEGTTIWISIAGANRSKDVWGSDADVWKPERWLNNEFKGNNLAKNPAGYGKVKLPGIYSGMLTFLGGGRSCIGYGFAIMEMKIILVTLLSAFCFSATEDKIVWNLSQIMSPSFTGAINDTEEMQGMPLGVHQFS